MTPARFLETRRPFWDRLDVLVRKAGRRGVTALAPAEVHALARLYPAVAVDVARTRMYGLDAATQRRVNRLAVAAHGLLYRRRRPRPVASVVRFFVRDFPRLWRRMWVYMAVASAVFLLAGLGAYVTCRLRPATAYAFVEHGLDVEDQARVTAEDVSERYRQMPGGLMNAVITMNNILVALKAFALGITAGLGTGFVLLANGMMLGAFIAHFQNHGLGWEVASFLTPHGALEIFAVLVAGAAGMRLGLALAVPGRGETRRASLRSGARDAVLLVLGTVPMFMVAGFVESFVTPSYAPGGLKIFLGLALLAVVLTYLLLAGRDAPRRVR